MKKGILLTQILIVGIAGSAAAQQFRLEGSLGKKAEGATVTINYLKGNGYQTDSAKVKNGKFLITGDMKEPVKAFVRLIPAVKPGETNTQNNDYTEIFLEPRKTTMKSSDGLLSTATVKGGTGQKELAELQRRLKPVNARMQALVDSMTKRISEDETTASKFRVVSQPLYDEMDSIRAAFVAEYPDSYLSLSIVKDKSAIIDPVKFEPLFNSLSERLRNTDGAKAIAARLVVVKKLAIGQKAPDFTLNDTTGTPVSLSSLKGQYVLIDFWASWCGPCRQENPNLVKAYAKYKPHNFQILGITLDKQPAPWITAINEDGLKWLHVRNIKDTPNDVAKQYDIRAVPQSFLIDPNGVIIARNLRGKELEDKLEEVLKN
ncbi:AhpC/TSA family protein [Pseudoflavitalea sp. G-6-1-2]|uniref:TlpA disulfide reductase family protein n=1 Tax=Pseudoflavitalea sp. G-6-1-2 TaxID=2728841 RepID=UPI00146C01B7|nr:TlpA disulfide reductase family protein [Pseudoflavitalea sp. G-6-1-2]NML22579.1 AhpC/TSA family protein [Pseudoflavitalea sp. G-6-1-2]